MIVELFIGVCMLASHQCLPELDMPATFHTIDDCDQYVRAAMTGSPNDERPAILGDIALTFRCAVRS